MGSDSHVQSNKQTRLLKFGNPCLHPDYLFKGTSLTTIQTRERGNMRTTPFGIIRDIYGRFTYKAFLMMSLLQRCTIRSAEAVTCCYYTIVMTYKCIL